MSREPQSSHDADPGAPQSSQSPAKIPPHLADAVVGHPSWARYRALLFLCAAAVIAYLGRTAWGVAAEDVQADVGITEVQMGGIMSAFFAGYSLGQIPVGWMSQRTGARLALPMCALLWSCMCASVWFGRSWSSLVAIQFFFGLAQAGIFPISASVISNWIPTARRALASGALGSSMSVGAAMASQFAGVLLQFMAWRWMFVLYAVPGVIWAVWFYAWYRNRPDQHSAVNKLELAIIHDDNLERKSKVLDKEGGPSWFTAFNSFALWMVCGQQFFRAAGYIFYATWFPKYLKETYGVSTLASGLFASLPLIAVVLGSVTGGWVIDRIWRATKSRDWSRRAVGVAAMTTCAALILLAYFIKDPLAAVLVISAGSLIAAIGGPAAYTVTIEMAADKVPPIFGAMNTSGNIGAMICPTVVATFVTHYGWAPALLLFVGIYLGAALCWLALNPNGTFFDSVPGMAKKV